MLSTRAEISSLCQRGVGKDQNIVEKVALETAKTATEESTVILSEVVAEKPERVRPDEVCEGSSIAERKTRHQVEVQNWQGEIDEMTSRVR